MEKSAIGWGSAATALASHLIPNIAMLKGLRSKRVAQHIGDHFSSGLFNVPVSRTKAFVQGMVAGAMPELPLLQEQARDLGNKIREHLVSSGFKFTGQHSISAIHEAINGNVGKAMSYDPEVAHAVLEFAKQNKANPLLMAANLKALGKQDHPLITNVLPNLIRLPKRRKVVGKALEEGAAAERPLKSILQKAPSPEELEGMKWNLKNKPTTKAPLPKKVEDEGIRWGGSEKDFGKVTPYPKESPRKMSDEEIDALSKQYTSRFHGLKKKFTPEMESYVPELSQLIGPAASSRKGYRFMGAMAGSGAAGLADPAMGVSNALKYTYFASPKVRDILGKITVPFRGKRLGVNEAMDAMTSKQIQDSFLRGAVEDRDLNPITNFAHRYLVSGIQGEAARTSNALGRAIGSAVPPEHRKNVAENVIGAVKGIPGSLQAKTPGPPIGEQLKPFIRPAVGMAAAGTAAYGAGRYQKEKQRQGRPPVAPGGNVLPFVQPPAQGPMSEPGPVMQYGG